MNNISSNRQCFIAGRRSFFEHVARAFDGVEKIKDSSQEEKILALEQKLQTKNEVLSELMEEHLKLKKTLGKSEWSMDSTRFKRQCC